MRAVFALLLLWATSVAGVAQAEGKPLVVIELFTSQGCSSCPPADKLLAELAKRDDVLPLALHVDYWDYIGWEDSFARPEHTDRQKSYAHVAGSRSIYTPQMIIGGIDHIVGFKPMEVADYIQMHRELAGLVRLDVMLQAGTMTVRAEPALAASLPDQIDVLVVEFSLLETIEIGRGENAGHTLTYANIVTDMQNIGVWDGHSTFELTTALPGDMPAAVILQTAGPGPILAALRVR